VLPVVADALATPLAEGSCGGATMGFGLRNLADVDAGLREARRLLARGSRVVLLEFVRPTGLLAPIKCAVLRTFVPLVVRLVARSRVSAYAYLTRSITEFLSVEELTARLREVGFTDLTVQQRLLGIVAIVGATKR
jgi:demethylmenaquinone methyltransferase/2-methoxy-6-polyprenyl-1,4-benzoquinol methylase